MFKVGDTVRVLPNKKEGIVTDISDWFVILDGNQARPYMPQQLELVVKRYVLLNDYNLILDSKNEKELRVVHYDDGDVLKVVADNWYYPLEKLDYKTSDNILDLIETNDLLDLDGEIAHVFGIDEETGGYVLMNKDVIIKDSCLIKAIYKRQSNGDYKRYEVK